jgi:hypothetical protein
MTSIDELKRIAGREKVGVGMVEKDHAITVALLIISRTEFSRTMVFKGGTAIKKMFYPETRFSEDLDFNCERDIAEELGKKIKRSLIENNQGVAFTGVSQEEPRSDEGRRLRFGYKDSNGYPSSIRLDLAFREKSIMRARKMEVKNLYGVRKIIVTTMNIEEIAAEKVRALIVTRRPRHLYDVWFLLRKQIKPSNELIDQKLKLYDKKFDVDILRSSIKEVQVDWQTDLEALTSEVPRFSDVEQYVADAFQDSSSKK